MNSEEYAKKVYNILKEADLKVKNDTVYYNGQFGVKCPYCGHTDKSRTSTHLNIKLTNLDGGFPVFRCVKCETSGKVDKEFLEDLEIYNTDLSYLQSQLKIEMSKNVHRKGLKNNKVQIKILPPLNINSTHTKIQYLEDRLGIKLTTKDILHYKIILNLKDFLAYNKLNYTRDPRVIDSLDEKYIGFLSANNEFISFRNITGNYNKYEKRYINYNIFNLDENTRRIYTIPNKINILKPVHVILAEGAIDILGIYNHIYNKNPDENTLFVATMGMGHDNVIKYLNKMGILFAHYEIYSDTNMNLSDYRQMKKKLGYNLDMCTLDVCFNKLSKDCGVTKDKISIQRYRV